MSLDQFLLVHPFGAPDDPATFNSFGLRRRVAGRCGV
jgi:hypothetical protein